MHVTAITWTFCILLRSFNFHVLQHNASTAKNVYCTTATFPYSLQWLSIFFLFQLLVADLIWWFFIFMESQLNVVLSKNARNRFGWIENSLKILINNEKKNFQHFPSTTSTTQHIRIFFGHLCHFHPFDVVFRYSFLRFGSCVKIMKIIITVMSVTWTQLEHMSAKCSLDVVSKCVVNMFSCWEILNSI